MPENKVKDAELEEGAMLEEDDAGDEPAVYELGYHVISTVTEETLTQEVTKVTNLLKELGADFIGEGFPSRINLAYTISKKIDGTRRDFDAVYFGWVTFELLPSKVSELKAKMEALPSMLRFLIIRTTREALLAASQPIVERIGASGAGLKRLVEDESQAGEVSQKALDDVLEGIVSGSEEIPAK